MGQPVDVSELDQEACCPIDDEITVSSYVRGYHRPPRSHGLHDAPCQAFLLGGQDYNVAPRKDRGDVRSKPQEVDPRNPVLQDLCFESSSNTAIADQE